jgi:hypothetical protein
VSPRRHRDGVLLAVIPDDNHAPPGLVVVDADHPRSANQHGRTLRRPGFEQLDDTWKTVGDVLTDDAHVPHRRHRR